jgi:hypothetical protein
MVFCLGDATTVVKKGVARGGGIKPRKPWVEVIFTHFRIKPLALASGHGRYITVAYCRYKFITVSLPKRFRNGRFNSETAVPPSGSRST